MNRFLFTAFCLLPALACSGQAFMHKLSPAARAAYREYTARRAETDNGGAKKAGANGAATRMFAFVRTAGDAAGIYSPTGTDVLASFGDIDIVSLPVASLPVLADDARIVKIETGRANEPANTATAQIIGADKARSGDGLPQAYTGKGVLVGVEDIGFDLTNPVLYTADKAEYRVRALWDMLSADTLDSRMPIGRDYTDRDSIIALGHTRDGLTCLHGSHTLGTSAGSGYGSDYSGIAPESDICLVCNVTTDNKEYVADALTGVDYGTPLTALGFKYIFDYADSAGQPCVISLSEGSYADFTEDTELYYDVLARMTGEGRIIVASAGNNSQTMCYLCKPKGEESAGTFLENYGSQLFYMAQGDDDFTIRTTIYSDDPVTRLVDTAGLREHIDEIISDTLTAGGTQYVFTYTAYPSAYDAGHIVVEFVIEGPAKIGYTSGQPISAEFIGENAEVEAYRLVGNFVDKPSVNAALTGAETSHNVFAPASAPAVVAVGASAYATSFANLSGQTVTNDYGSGGTRAVFSSVGPTLDGRIKPDVVAPGTNIISSTNSFFFEANPTADTWSDLVGSYDFNGRTYYWKADTGTSMSAPFVAGAVALWLEADNSLTPDDVKDIIARTSTRPDPSLTYPNNQYGYGQIDIYAGLLGVLGLDGISAISRTQPSGVSIRPAEGGYAAISFDAPLRRDARIEIYTAGGQRNQTPVIRAGETTPAVRHNGKPGDI
ncbi:MAG: S8 family serine peptidase, partial [Prevotella sp.]|nr:S8 family serine peptidase [Prevotella sp.]